MEALGDLILNHLQAVHADHVTEQQREHSINIYQVLASFTLNVITHFIPLPKVYILWSLIGLLSSNMKFIGLSVICPDDSSSSFS